MSKSFKLNPTLYFSWWLIDSNARRYLLHFSEVQWLEVAKSTLLLGLGYLEFQGLDLSQICPRKLECLFEDSHVPFARGGDVDNAGWAVPHEKQARRKAVAFEIYNVVAKTRRIKLKRTTRGRRLIRNKIKNADISEVPTEFPSDWSCYLAFRQLFLQFPEALWPRLIKYLFLLGLCYLAFLGVPLQTLSVPLLREVVFEYGCALPGDCLRRQKRRYVLRLLPFRPSPVSIQNVNAKNCSSNAQPLLNSENTYIKSPLLLETQKAFPVQWISPPCGTTLKIKSKLQKNDFPIKRKYAKWSQKTLQIYPAWWGEKPLRLLIKNKDCKNLAFGSCSQQASDISSEGHAALQLLKFQAPWAAKHLNSTPASNRSAFFKRRRIRDAQKPFVTRRCCASSLGTGSATRTKTTSQKDMKHARRQEAPSAKKIQDTNIYSKTRILGLEFTTNTSTVPGVLKKEHKGKVNVQKCKQSVSLKSSEVLSQVTQTTSEHSNKKPSTTTPHYLGVLKRKQQLLQQSKADTSPHLTNTQNLEEQQPAVRKINTAGAIPATVKVGNKKDLVAMEDVVRSWSRGNLRSKGQLNACPLLSNNQRRKRQPESKEGVSGGRHFAATAPPSCADSNSITQKNSLKTPTDILDPHTVEELWKNSLRNWYDTSDELRSIKESGFNGRNSSNQIITVPKYQNCSMNNRLASKNFTREASQARQLHSDQSFTNFPHVASTQRTPTSLPLNLMAHIQSQKQQAV